MITRDKDFLAIHRHAGIVYCPPGRLSAKYLATFLTDLQSDSQQTDELTLDDILDAVWNGIITAAAILSGTILALALLN